MFLFKVKLLSYSEKKSALKRRHFRDVGRTKWQLVCFHQQRKFKVDLKGMYKKTNLVCIRRVMTRSLSSLSLAADHWEVWRRCRL